MTELRLSNTLSGEKEVFEPLDDDRVLLYVCGLTVSDDPHLGHARTWVSFDVLHRYLEYKGYDVKHVENVTDVNERYGLALPEADYTTVAGYTLGCLGRLARPGDEVDFEGGRLRVLAVDGRRILRMALFLDTPDLDGDEPTD